MTEAIYLEVTEKAEAAHKAKRRVSVSGMLKILGISRSGYRAWLKHVPSNAEKRRESVKAKIKDIYDKSKQNYGAPKITQVLCKTGETISERTVGQYMKQMVIKAQWVKPWTITTRDSDFSSKLQNILDEQFNPERPNAVWCSDITYIWTIDGFVYLTSIMDLYSRKIIAWTLSKTLEVSYVIVSVSGMLKHLGVSRSGYHAWLKRVLSNTEKRREAAKAKIQDIYDESKQNYGAPKITKELRKSGEIISERTVGKYMKQMGIKAQWVKPWTITTKDSDFSSELKNILDEQFNPERPNVVWWQVKMRKTSF